MSFKPKKKLPDIKKVKSDLQDHQQTCSELERKVKKATAESNALSLRKQELTHLINNHRDMINDFENLEIELHNKIEKVVISQSKSKLAAASTCTRIKQHQMDQTRSKTDFPKMPIDNLRLQIEEMEKRKKELLNVTKNIK